MLGMTAKRGKRVSEAEFRRLWEDMSISQAEIGRRLGISGEAVRYRAKTRKLQPRPKGYPFARKVNEARAVRLYLTGYSEGAVAVIMGHPRPTIQAALNRAGVVRRSRNDPTSISADKALRIAMAASARAEQAALWNAEMVDGDPRRRAAA